MRWRARDLRALRCGNWPGCAQAMWYLQRFKRLYQKAECFAKSARFFFRRAGSTPIILKWNAAGRTWTKSQGWLLTRPSVYLNPRLETCRLRWCLKIGRMTTPLSKLADLQTGDVLETTFETAPDVGIRAQGKLIASAKLVRVGERLGAQITQMMRLEPQPQQDADLSKPEEQSVEQPIEDDALKPEGTDHGNESA